MSASEDDITAWFERRSSLPVGELPIGIGDDMAEIRWRGETVLITTDMLLDGVHFDLKEVSLEQAGYKAMAVSLSDCAAMATQPVAAVVSTALPKGFGAAELKELHGGIVRAGDMFGCALIGGDITSWRGQGRFAVSAAVLSRAVEGGPVSRSGAKVGDCICVTGELGGSLRGKHLAFTPRVTEAMKIAEMVRLNSMIDLSDGLSSDLNRICRRSVVGAIIDSESVPISEAAKQSEDALGAALGDGEDFELLFTLSEVDCERLLQLWDEDLAITKIGVVTDTGRMEIRGGDGVVSELKAEGYEHLGN
ncbi:MAG: thiamine-phosphate kinase [Planctomycetota bacterium]|jgi:thiamine-monophosphate kinase